MQNPHLEGDAFYWPGGSTGVLLIHGFTATTAEVRPLGQLLHQEGYAVAGPLLPGHGTRVQELNRVRWQDWTAAVETAYQELARQCQQVIVGGESTGGLLALYLASQHPEVVAVLCYAAFLRMRSRLMELLAPLLAPLVPVVEKSKSAPTPADERWQGYTVYPVPAAAQLFRLQRHMRRLLPDVRQPILIVQGRNDATVDPRAPQMIYGGVRSTDKELHWMEDSSHCVILDGEWERVAGITSRFLQRVLAKQTGQGDRA